MDDEDIIKEIRLTTWHKSSCFDELEESKINRQGREKKRTVVNTSRSVKRRKSDSIGLALLWKHG